MHSVLQQEHNLILGGPKERKAYHEVDFASALMQLRLILLIHHPVKLLGCWWLGLNWGPECRMDDHHPQGKLGTRVRKSEDPSVWLSCGLVAVLYSTFNRGIGFSSHSSERLQKSLTCSSQTSI